MTARTASEIHRPNKHCLCHHKLYSVWKSMKERCNNPNARDYRNYGARKIFVADEWQDEFVPFFEWSIGHGYHEGLQLDRIDNDGPYAPWNCKFSDKKQQANNRRTNRSFYYNGVWYRTLKQFCESHNLHYAMFRNYITYLHMPIEKAMHKCNLDIIYGERKASDSHV